MSKFDIRWCIYVLALASVTVLPVWGKGIPIIIDEDNWKQVLEGEWMVEFFAPWCPACKSLQPAWESFAEWSDDLAIKVGQVDVTENPGLSGRFLVTALPTIFHIKDGDFRTYRGSRDKNDFISFIEDKKWESVEKVSSWKSADSFLMSLVSYFFRLSMFMRSVHNAMIEEYGIPYWASYIIFALATIVIGAVLGLILVCFIDYFYPQDSVNSKDVKVPIIRDEDDDIVDDMSPVPNNHQPSHSQSQSEDEEEEEEGSQSQEEGEASQQSEELEEEEDEESSQNKKEEDKENRGDAKEVRKRTNVRKDD